MCHKTGLKENSIPSYYNVSGKLMFHEGKKKCSFDIILDRPVSWTQTPSKFIKLKKDNISCATSSFKYRTQQNFLRKLNSQTIQNIVQYTIDNCIQLSFISPGISLTTRNYFIFKNECSAFVLNFKVITPITTKHQKNHAIKCYSKSNNLNRAGRKFFHLAFIERNI